LSALPLQAIQNAPEDRVATAVAARMFGPAAVRDHGGRDHDLDIRLRQWNYFVRRARLLRYGLARR